MYRRNLSFFLGYEKDFCPHVLTVGIGRQVTVDSGTVGYTLAVGDTPKVNQTVPTESAGALCMGRIEPLDRGGMWPTEGTRQ